MRLQRLDLTRYGKFTDRSIEFGPRDGDEPDLHIVFGLNEAGKSTALSGYLDLLFGIEERSRYNFLHEYGAMRVGGVLEFEGRVQEIFRTKQRSNSLFDIGGQPLSEIAITAQLAGISRDAYQTMFSLDDETLEAGGKSILESRGDLGKLLFAASAGLTHANETLSALETEADAIYRKQAHSTEIALLKKRLGELKSKKDTIDTLASRYEALEAERRDAAERYEASISERSVLATRLEAIAKHLRLIPILAEIRRKSAQIAEFPDVATPLRTWTGSLSEMINDDARLTAQLSANLHEIERVTEKAAGLSVDDTILSASERIRGLAELNSQYVSAGLHLPNRRLELQLLDSELSACLGVLGRKGEPEPERLILPAAVVGSLRSLIEQRSGVVTSVQAARDEVAAAIDAFNAARESVSEERAVPEPVRAKLISVLVSARNSSHVHELKQAQLAEDVARLRWAASVRRLQPWSGDSAALMSMSVPSGSQLAEWKDTARECAKQRALLSDQLAEHEGAHQRLTERLAAIRTSAEIVDDEAAATLRHARNEAWKIHRQDLSAVTADQFSRAMDRDDKAASLRLASARELAEIRTISQNLAEATARIAARRDQLIGLDELLASVRTKVSAAAGDLLFEGCADLSLDRLIGLIEQRIADRTESLAASDEIAVAVKRSERSVATERQLKDELSRALETVGIQSTTSDNLETTVAAAQLFLDRQVKLDAAQAEAAKTVKAREEDLASRRRALDAAERREEEWLVRFAETLRGTWLEGTASPANIGNVLDRLADLDRTLQSQQALTLRIAKMEEDRERFVAEVRASAAEVSEPAGDGPDQCAVRLANRLEAAVRARDAKAGLGEDLQRLQDARDVIEAENQNYLRRKDEVLRAFGASTLTEAVDRDELLKERDRLRDTIAQLEDQLTAELATETAAQASSILDALDPDSLRVDQAESEQRLRDLDEVMKEQLVRRARTSVKLDEIGGDDAVARIDAERRTILLELEEKAIRYIERKLGVMAAQNALRSYREDHRSGMMARASDAFASITRGQYAGLTTQPSKGGDVLVAMQRDGQSKMADTLSKGAQFQLYLALRLAGYYEFARHRPSVPFIADDIMETFDHVRSEEVFRLFAEMARIGQVIYLTHHQHLCEIAKRVVPGVRIHNLD
jgi:uncharacterized protein YhaN